MGSGYVLTLATPPLLEEIVWACMRVFLIVYYYFAKNFNY